VSTENVFEPLGRNVMMMQLLDATDWGLGTGLQFMKARTEILTNAVGPELEPDPEPEMRKFNGVGGREYSLAIWRPRLSRPRVMLIVGASI